MVDEPTLTQRMRTLAATHPRGAELLDAADKCDAATAGFYGEPQTYTGQQFLGTYARAKKLWCECSGEPLVSPAVVKAAAGLFDALRRKEPHPNE